MLQAYQQCNTSDKAVFPASHGLAAVRDPEPELTCRYIQHKCGHLGWVCAMPALVLVRCCPHS